MIRKIPKEKLIMITVDGVPVRGIKSITSKARNGFYHSGEIDHDKISLEFYLDNFSMKLKGRKNIERLKDMLDHLLEIPEGEK